MPTIAETPNWSLNRELLRQAGEHLGTLAERAREQYETRLSPGFSRGASMSLYNRMSKLQRLSREVLEIANA